MLKMAILGRGNWAQRLVRSVQGKSDKVQFFAVGSSQPAEATDFSEMFSLEVKSHEAAIADPQIDAVLIASSHGEHLGHALAAAAAKKHILIEKPLALSKSDACRIVEACEENGVRLAHGYNRRFAPSYLEMLSRLHAGEIGELLHLEGQFSGPSGFALKPGAWRADRAQSPMGAMTARGIHTLDSLISMAGPVKSVFAQSDQRVLSVDLDDVTSALLRFASGATGYIASHHVTAEIWRVQIYGSKGWMEMRSDVALDIARIGDDIESLSFAPVDKERAEIEAFADYVGGTASYPVTNAQAVNSIATIDAMTSSVASQQQVSINS